MAEACEDMLGQALFAFAEDRPKAALDLARSDEEVDELHDRTVRELVEQMRVHPDSIDECLDLLLVSRTLERLADHVTNIGEWVVYGQTARHIALNP
jgi:phosphate transport system protein